MSISIGTTYNPARAQFSKEYAYECWKDYTYGKNKLNISEEEMAVLTEKYANDLRRWEKTATEDITIYEIDDSDFDLSELDKKQTVNKTDQNKQNAQKIADEVKEKVEKKSVEKPDMANQKNMNMASGISVAGTAATGIGTAAAACGAWAYGLMTGCYVALAVGILYQATRPNQEPRNALMTLQEQMLQLQDSLESGQDQLNTLSDDLATSTEDMQSSTEDKQETIAEKEELYQTCLAIYTQIYDRVMAGEQISESDKAKINECGAQLVAMGKEISALKAEFEADKEEMAAYVDDQATIYEENANVLMESSDTTELANSFDEQTEKMIKWQVAAQSVNAAAGLAMGTAALAIGWMVPPYMVAGFAGIAGGALSLAGAGEQGKFLTEVKSEINDRVDTQTDLSATTEVFNSSIGTYQESVGTVNEQNLEISGGLLTAENFESVKVSDSQIEGANGADVAEQDSTGVNPFAQTANNEPEIKNPFA